MRINGLHPAIIREYDAEKRFCRVEILGVTDGAEELPIAEIMYPLGDRSTYTEIEIINDSPVWVQFHGGDTRYPIIVGYRAVNTGNVVGTRKTRHVNLEFEADELAKIKVGVSEFEMTPANIKLTVGASSIEITPLKITFTTPEGEFSALLTILGATAMQGGFTASGGVGASTINVPVDINNTLDVTGIVTATDVKTDNIASINAHKHDDPQGGETDVPNG